MVFSCFDFSVSEAELRARCDCTIFGTDALLAVDTARQLGFTKTAKHNLSPDELQPLLAEGHYPIVYVNLLPLDEREGAHALVMLEIENDSVTVYDPNQGERLLPLHAFIKAWKLKHYLTIIVDK